MRLSRIYPVLGMWIFLAGVMADSFPLAALTLQEAAGFIHKPVLAGTGIEAAGKNYRNGHLQIQFQSGKLYPVKINDQLIGFFFAGQGIMQYQAEKYARGALNANLKYHMNVSLETGGILTGRCEAVLLYASGGLETLAGIGTAEGAVPEEAQQALLKHRARFDQCTGTLASTFFPPALIDRPASPTVYCEIIGERDDFLYFGDTLTAGAEELYLLKAFQTSISFLKELRYRVLLSRQPLGRGWLDPEIRRFILTALDVELVNPSGMSLQLKTTQTYRFNQAVKVLDLRLWNERVITSGVTGKIGKQPYQIEKIERQDHTALSYVHYRGDLCIELPKVYQPGETVTLLFQLSGNILFNPNNDNYWFLGLSPWFPLTRPDMEACTYHAVCKVRKPYTVFTCGQTVRRWEEGDLACAEFQQDKPVQSIAVLAGNYKTHSETLNNITVSVSSYAGSNTIANKQLAGMMHGMISFYQNFLGEFPFRELKVIEINDYGYGQAPPGIVFITTEAFTPQRDTLASIFSEGINARLAHELAHAWWGNVALLGNDQDNWMSESISEYFGAFAMGSLKHPDEFRKKLSLWHKDGISAKDKSSIATADSLSGDDGSQDRTRLLYRKGPLMLQAFRQKAGDNAFFTIMKSYLRSFPYQPMDTRNFLKVVQAVLKQDYSAWFEEQLFGMDWPQI